MKKLLLCCLFLFALTACAINKEAEYVLPDPINENASKIKIDSSTLKAELLDTVTTRSKEINVLITGSNIADSGLYYFVVPMLEKNEEGTWRRIPVNQNVWEQITGDPDYYWSSCYREDGASVMWDTASIYTSDLAEQLNPGEYRVIIFFPDRTLYVPFSVVE